MADHACCPCVERLTTALRLSETKLLNTGGDVMLMAARADKAEAELALLRVERNQLADKLTLCMLDRKRERDHVHLLQGEIRQLSAAMWDAIECVEAWAAYASEYFKEKHDLAGDLARLRAAMKGKPGK